MVTRISVSVDPIIVSFSQKLAVMGREALSLAVFKKPTVMGLALKVSSVVVDRCIIKRRSLKKKCYLSATRCELTVHMH
jgi:hypothetical protein